MGYFGRFQHRDWVEELMDDPNGDVTRLHRTLRQFRFINRFFSRVHRPLVRLVLNDMTAERTCTLLDIGAGDGDIARRLVRAARKRGLSLRITCIDADERIATWCREQCAAYPEIEVLHARHDSLQKRFDYVFTNHVLHHLDDGSAVGFLGSMDRIADRRVIISDLERSAFSYAAFSVFATLAFHRSFARVDGQRSLRRAFRRDEVRTLLARTRWGGRARVSAAFPAHMLIVCEFP